VRKIKNKILNDPIYGFITIPNTFIYNIIQHTYFQRLRRISQLGLSCLVYPGANHTRFHHAIGAMHLMQKAINVLKNKNIKITKSEEQALLLAILLHDIGHGPFSHALEHSLTKNISHEKISLLFMEELNKQFNGKLSLTIEIFTNNYKKKFLHQLISSQIDVDRLDYLNRDSFYSGVAEGIVNSKRIIDMYNVFNQELVIENKGLYSIEKFLLARKLMYLQVYTHKTVLSAEYTLMHILKRAKEIFKKEKNLFHTKSIRPFLNNTVNLFEKNKRKENLNLFSEIDDYDVLTCVKEWCDSEDFILSSLCKKVIKRELLKIHEIEKVHKKNITNNLKLVSKKALQLSNRDLKYFIFYIQTKNKIYDKKNNPIKMMHQQGKTVSLSNIEQDLHFNKHQNTIIKNFICFPKGYKI
jgi:HD superfamily phosphohydrolase